MSEWQPISTAPKDGTRVLVYPTLTVAMWRSYRNDGDDAGWSDGLVKSWAYEEITELEPTHWQSLPAPPEERETARELKPITDADLYVECP